MFLFSLLVLFDSTLSDQIPRFALFFPAFHCHIAFHLVLGFMALLVVSPEKIKSMKIPQDNLDLCTASEFNSTISLLHPVRCQADPGSNQFFQISLCLESTSKIKSQLVVVFSISTSTNPELFGKESPEKPSNRKGTFILQLLYNRFPQVSKPSHSI